MTTSWIVKRLLSEYENWNQVAAALGYSHQRCRAWEAAGFVSERAALDIEQLDIGIDAYQVLEEAQKFRSRSAR